MIELLKVMKELVHNTEGTQYEFWVMQNQVRSLAKIEQGKYEGLASYSKRFLDQVSVTEEVWGLMIPEKMDDKDDAKKIADSVKAIESEKNAAGKTFGELIKAGMLPGG